jgi:hypothetical protein
MIPFYSGFDFTVYALLFIMFFFQFTSQSFDDVGSSFQVSISSISSLRDRSFSLKSITPSINSAFSGLASSNSTSINSAFSGLASSNSTPVYSNSVSICRLLNWFHSYRVRHGCDRMVVGFTYTYAIKCLMLWVRILIRARCTTLCDKVCQWLATCRWFSPGPPPIKLTATI